MLLNCLLIASFSAFTRRKYLPSHLLWRVSKCLDFYNFFFMWWSFERVQGRRWWWLVGLGLKIMANAKWRWKRIRYFLMKLRTTLVKHPLCYIVGNTRPFQLSRSAETAFARSEKWYMVTVLKPAVFHSAAVELRTAEWFALSGPVIHMQSPVNTFQHSFSFRMKTAFRNTDFPLLQKKETISPSFFFGN